MNLTTKFTIISSVLLLSGCALSPVNTSSDNYQIHAIPSVVTQKTHPITLLVLSPETNAIYNTRQIAYTTRPYQVAYFAKNRWAETPAKMLEQNIVETLQKTHYFAAVISPPVIGRYDYVLSTKLIELNQDFMHKPSVVRLVVQAQLTQASTSRVIAVKQFTFTQIAPCDTPYGGVIAANRAVARLLQEIVWFTTRV